MSVHEALEHPWLASSADPSDSDERIPASNYHGVRDRIRQKYVSLFDSRFSKNVVQ